MSNLLAGLLAVLVATNHLDAASNLVEKATGVSVKVPDPNDPVEKEYRKLLADDDAAREEIDKWIRDAQAFEEKGAGSPQATLNLRIDQRLTPVRKAYEDFLQRNPKHVKARVAYASFLTETGDEHGGAKELEKALELDPRDPAIWNNLANYYGHRSPVKKSFEYYAKAIELDPNEPVYYWNFATTVYLFRKDAMEFYGITEDQVFDKALDLYREAVKRDPKNFVLYSDYAQSFYGTKPPRWKEGVEAWTHALNIAADDIERDGVHIHIARCHINLGNFDEARKHLGMVNSEMYSGLKSTLSKKLERTEAESNSDSEEKK